MTLVRFIRFKRHPAMVLMPSSPENSRLRKRRRLFCIMFPDFAVNEAIFRLHFHRPRRKNGDSWNQTSSPGGKP
jgi:hypothetical protein